MANMSAIGGASFLEPSAIMNMSVMSRGFGMPNNQGYMNLGVAEPLFLPMDPASRAARMSGVPASAHQSGIMVGGGTIMDDEQPAQMSRLLGTSRNQMMNTS